jgi:cytochrome c oxidase subunit 1
MVLPAMGVVSELIANFSRKNIFGYKFVAFSSLAIAVLGFLVWGHHLFVASQSVYAGDFFIPQFCRRDSFSHQSLSIGLRRSTRLRFRTTRRCSTAWLYRLFTIGGMTGMFLPLWGPTST